MTRSTARARSGSNGSANVCGDLRGRDVDGCRRARLRLDRWVDTKGPNMDRGAGSYLFSTNLVLIRNLNLNLNRLLASLVSGVIN